MTNTGLVRPSRDGDQFHYLWAARRCLLLLQPAADLVAVAIEGTSPTEQSATDPALGGEDVIDVAEYYGDQSIEHARKVCYRQLKHSTLRASETWTASGLEKTLSGFSTRYKNLRKQFEASECSKRFEFTFVTNRPVSADILETVDDAATSRTARHPNELKKLERHTGLGGSELSSFCKALRFEAKQDDYWEQRNILIQEMSGYLPDSDVDAPAQLKELVTKKALSEFESNPVITKVDVLRALKTDESKLYPAPCLIASIDRVVPREQEQELVRAIVVAGSAPVIIHAVGGVGKSIVAKRISEQLPDGSVAVVYDCFGNGLYRSATGYRHRHQEALVQISNELACQGLCHPLIPTPHADASAYLKAFDFRLRQAVALLSHQRPQAFVCILIDAADNAQIAAEEVGQARSFVRDLVRHILPDRVRLVMLCRSERRDKLDPPPSVIQLELKSFSRSETAVHLRGTFPTSTEPDVDEFHRLTSQNPRVQALALSRKLPLQDTLRVLGPAPTTVESAIGGLLRNAIEKLRDDAVAIEKDRVDKICSGLASLRPLIPISVLSQMSGVSEDAIRSFALDLGRPLLVTDGTIQFLDEPVETWFREHFKPSSNAMGAFIRELAPLASKSAYVASTLPQLMLEAGQFSELVTLALGSTALPDGSPLERRDVELQRLQFALKASLRAKRYRDAAKLAFKAGGETAGDDRQRRMLQANTDLAAAFLELETIQELVSRRTFGSKWLGSHNAYEAGLLSGRKELIGDARSRIRMAGEWLDNWGQLSADERKKEAVEDEDIAELALAQLNVHGATATARDIGGWKPREVSYRVGRLVASRLIDHGRLQDVNDIAKAAGNNLCLLLAIVEELRAIQELPSADVVKAAFECVHRNPRKLKHHRRWDSEGELLSAIVSLVEATLLTNTGTKDAAAAVLTRYLPKTPPRGLSSRHSNSRAPLLRAYTLRAALQSATLQLIDLAHPELKAELEKEKRHHTTQDGQEFLEDVGALLPWHQLRASSVVGEVTQETFDERLARTREASAKAEKINYREESHTSNEIALIWFGLLYRLDATAATYQEAFADWSEKLKRPLFTPTLTSLTRLGARKEATKAMAMNFATQAFKLMEGEREDADAKVSGYLTIARAVLPISQDEAKAYFNEAVTVASKFGDENLSRWDAVLNFAEHSARQDRPVPAVAYRFARCAELTRAYVDRDKHFDWHATVEAMTALCPNSCFAIISRWRDRCFGRSGRILPIAIEYLIDRDILDGRDAQALVPILAEWDYPKLLRSSLNKAKDSNEKKSAAKHFFRYVGLDQHDKKIWTSLQTVLGEHRITEPSLAPQIAFTASLENARIEDGAGASSTDCSRSKNHWDTIFAGFNLGTTEGLSGSYANFRAGEPPFYSDRFFAELFLRISPGQEAAVIDAAAKVPGFTLFELRSLLNAIPGLSKDRPAVKQSLAATLKTYCRRFCMGISNNRHYEILPLREACALAGVNVSDVVEVVLDGIGEASDLLSAGRLFSLSGLLTFKLTQDEALEALEYALSLYEPVLKSDDSDGAWGAHLEPPTDISASIAGYVFVALASPSAEVRWEGAHTVVGMCALQRLDVVRHLLEFAEAATGGAFADANLPFYRLHALQWLLIGLARAAEEFPLSLATFSQQFVDWALQEQSHVLIRAFSARAALSLFRHNVATADSQTIKQLKNVNSPLLTPVATKGHERAKKKENAASAVETDKFFFGIDFGPYWLVPLGRVFALSKDDIEADALKVIRNELGYSSRGAWDEDPRERRKLYGRNKTYASHSSYPYADNQHFYLCYHAMLITAGKLLATRPTYYDPDSDQKDEFAYWLTRHDLSRDDGRWLFDRRDPAPLEVPPWYQTPSDNTAWKNINETELLGAWLASKEYCVWGHWNIYDATREETVTVRSALVSPVTAIALLSALKTAKEPHVYEIPSVDSDNEIHQGMFELKGWVSDHQRDREIDSRDRWSGGVRFPPPAPSVAIVSLCSLSDDADRRNWRDGSSAVVMWSSVWGSEPSDEEVNERANGEQLRSTREFVSEVLAKLEQQLVIGVTIERRRRYRKHERRDNDEPPIKETKFYLLKSDGTHVTI